MKKSLYPVVILAGGLATRLRPLTETIPKALIEVFDEAFVAHQLRLVHKQGVRHAVFCLGYLGEQVVDFIGNGQRFGLKIDYCFDGSQLLGTAGAIKKALPFVDENFFVLYGDAYLPCDYTAVQETFDSSHKLGLMTVYQNEGKWDTSNVEFKDNTIIEYDKKIRHEHMLHIDYGLEVFSRQAFDLVPDNTPYDLAILLQDLIKKNQLAAHEVKQRFYEVGSFAGIEELGYYLSQNS